ncbi:hypothetical protein BGX26_008485 [Mortierella sp. AD094]|nr:hypothetical protein BGX26_008485 [Mortierella sp. AD094]
MFGDRVALTDEMIMLCINLDREMESSGRIKLRSASDDFQEDSIHISDSNQSMANRESLIHVCQTIVRKLPRALSFSQEYEDTFAHSSMNALLRQFSKLLAAMNLPGPIGQQMAQKNVEETPLKPDATILKSNYELAFVEVKPPKEDRTAKPYLEDLW